MHHLLGGPLRQLFAVQLLIEGVAQGGLVVAEEDHQGGLVALAVVGDKLLQGQVALLHQVQELLRRPVRRLQIAGQLDVLGQVAPPLGVAAVVLHGDIKEEGGVLAFCGLVNHLVVRLVGDVAPDDVGVGDVLLVHLPVEVQILVGQHPVPAGGLIGVEGGGGVALAPGQGCQGGHALLHIELVGHRVRGLEQAGKAGEVLKLDGGGAAPGD